MNITGWTPPVYYADASTPKVGVTVIDDYHTYQIGGVPIPAGSLPSPDNNNSGNPPPVSGDGNDNYLQIMDTSTGCEYDFWKAYNNGSWHAKTEATFLTGGSGVHTPWPVRASGMALGAGIFLPAEIQAGAVNHALGVAIPLSVSGNTFVSPAQNTDGPTAGGIPMGTMFQLDPTLNLDTFSPTLPSWMKIFARTMQTWGMYVTDTSTGSIAIQGQATVSTGTYSYPWPQYSSLPKELVTHLRAVATPAPAPILDTWSTAGCAQRILVK